MHDHAIEARTKLKLEAETEEQAQELADLKLDREAMRARQRQDMEEAEQRHKNQLEALEHEEIVRQRDAEQQQEASGRRMINEVEQQHQKAMNTEQVAFLKAVQGLNVDMTSYLVAQYQHPDRLIRIEEGQKSPQVHLHD
jgi:hypothetical protein